MDVAGIGPMGEQLLPAVDRLQQQKVVDLGDAARAAGAVSRAASASPRWLSIPGELGDHAGQRQRRRAHERRRNPALVEGGPPVRRHLGDAGETDAEIARALLRLEHVAQSQTGDLQRRRLRRGGVRVVSFELAQRVAAFAAVHGDLDSSGLADRGGEIDDGIARALGQIERRRMIGFARDRERRAVLEDADRRAQRKPAGRQQVAIDRHLDDAPGVRTQRRRAGPHQHLQPAILLLEMLGAQKHAFLPDDPVRPCHRRLPFSRCCCLVQNRRSTDVR